MVSAPPSMAGVTVSGDFHHIYSAFPGRPSVTGTPACVATRGGEGTAPRVGSGARALPRLPPHPFVASSVVGSGEGLPSTQPVGIGPARRSRSFFSFRPSSPLVSPPRTMWAVAPLRQGSRCVPLSPPGPSSSPVMGVADRPPLSTPGASSEPPSGRGPPGLLSHPRGAPSSSPLAFHVPHSNPDGGPGNKYWRRCISRIASSGVAGRSPLRVRRPPCGAAGSITVSTASSCSAVSSCRSRRSLVFRAPGSDCSCPPLFSRSRSVLPPGVR